MKKFFFLAFSFWAVGTAIAKPVEPKIAQRDAERLLGKTVIDATPASFTECYLFVGTDGRGFALMAADDCVPPILGYSPDGVFPLDTSLPHHISTWFDAYQFDIAVMRKAGIVRTKFNTPRDTAVSPLVSTTWNQAPLYNQQCPYSASESAYSVTGCVATAMAQIMKYWNHPSVGRGSHSYQPSGFGVQTAVFDTTQYDWSHMPNALSLLSSQQEIDAVAQLMYHVGVAVEMAYSPRSSGAHVSAYGQLDFPSSENALKTYFRYNQALFSANREDYSDAQWDSLLTVELNASRPILFSGSDHEGGHAFVIDGYDSLGLYHVNWGWGGYCDGYYTFDNLSPTGSGIGGNASNAYSYNNKILLHVFPASEAATVTVSVYPSDSLLGTVTGGGTFQTYAPTTLLASASEGSRFLSWKSGNHANPFPFSPNNDYSDTALFARVYGDTLGYCFPLYNALWSESGNRNPEWGIRIPPVSIPSHRQLEGVQFYGVPGEQYTVKVYLGSNIGREVLSTTWNTSEFAWYTIPLPEVIPLIDSLPLWIALSSRVYTNAAASSYYSGNPDGSWYKRDGTSWEHLENRNEYASWMIRALLGELAPVIISVEPSQADRGSVTGGGSYYPGDTAILLATPAEGYRFARWSTGSRDNPCHYRVQGPESITAYFVTSEGIDEADAENLSVVQNGLDITISNPKGLPLSLYDITGRHLVTSNVSIFTFQFPIPGVYLLSSGETVRKLVVR